MFSFVGILLHGVFSLFRRRERKSTTTIITTTATEKTASRVAKIPAIARKVPLHSLREVLRSGKDHKEIPLSEKPTLYQSVLSFIAPRSGSATLGVASGNSPLEGGKSSRIPMSNVRQRVHSVRSVGFERPASRRLRFERSIPQLSATCCTVSPRSHRNKRIRAVTYVTISAVRCCKSGFSSIFLHSGARNHYFFFQNLGFSRLWVLSKSVPGV